MNRTAATLVAVGLLCAPTRVAMAAPQNLIDGPARTQALALLPEEVRAEVGDVVRTDRACLEGDGMPGVAVDQATHRIELCAGGPAGSLHRQIVFGAFLLFDARSGWSRLPEWRRLNAWSRGHLAPWRLAAGNRAPGAFAAPSGQASPAADLASFAAAWIEERANESGDAPPLTCRLLPQARFLHARLVGLHGVPPALAPPPRCRDFEAWAGRDKLERVELVMASPSTVTMASMFGHMFLRLVRRADATAQSPLDDPTMAFLVDSARPLTEEPFYALKGIAGVFAASLLEGTYLETHRTYVIYEGRDLRRFHLHLSSAETDALLERIWSLKQAGRFQYYFFSANCATLMVDLINSVLPPDRQVEVPQALATTPAGTLEGYAGTPSAAGRPLVTFIPETTFSFEHEARRASRARNDTAARLLAASSAQHRSAVQAALAGRDAVDADARARSYRALGTLAASFPADTRDDLLRFVREGVVIETHLSTLANHAAESVAWRDRRARLQGTVADLRARLATRDLGEDAACTASLRAALAAVGADQQDARLAGYRAIATELSDERHCAGAAAQDLRQLVLLETEARFDRTALPADVREAILFPESDKLLGEQAFARPVRDLIDYPFVTRIAPPLRALQQLKVAIRQLPGPQPTPADLGGQAAIAQREQESSEFARAVPRTGIDELEVGAGIEQGPGSRGVVVLAGAMHDERLGDQRRFGFPAHTELTVLRSQLNLARAERSVRISSFASRVLGWRSMKPSLEAGGGDSPLGAELFLDIGGRPSTGCRLSLRTGGGALLPLASSGTLANHLVLSAGGLLSLDQDDRPERSSAGVGARAALEARLALWPSHQSAWAGARVELRPLWTTSGPAREVVASAIVRLPLVQQFRLPLGPPRSLGLRLTGSLESSSRAEAMAAHACLSLAIE